MSTEHKGKVYRRGVIVATLSGIPRTTNDRFSVSQPAERWHRGLCFGSLLCKVKEK